MYAYSLHEKIGSIWCRPVLAKNMIIIIVEACYWYQQGCSIGCPTCDSVSGRVQVTEEEEKDQQRDKETKRQRNKERKRQRHKTTKRQKRK